MGGRRSGHLSRVQKVRRAPRSNTAHAARLSISLLVHDKLSLVELACTGPSIEALLRPGESVDRDLFGPCHSRHQSTELAQIAFVRLLNTGFVTRGSWRLKVFAVSTRTMGSLLQPRTTFVSMSTSPRIPTRRTSDPPTLQDAVDCSADQFLAIWKLHCHGLNAGRVRCTNQAHQDQHMD